MKSTSIVSTLDYYLEKLFPICRSITGNGNRETLSILNEIVPIRMIEYRSLKQVYDWKIPPEWNIDDAWIKNSAGKRLVNFHDSNLHVVNYSEPVRASMEFHELAPRLHFLKDQPEAIPYRTSYYERSWGFCVTQKQYESLKSVPGKLDVCIDSTLDNNGSLTIGELVIPGKSEKGYLVSTYICHPSMANDNLSGLVLTSFLAKSLQDAGTPNHTWTFVFVPETIGAITYLCHNEYRMKQVVGGLVVSCCGGPGAYGITETGMLNFMPQ